MPCTNKDCDLVERLAANQTLAEAELGFRRLIVMRALRLCHGHQMAAADMLNVHRNTLNRILTECAIEEQWIDLLKVKAAATRGTWFRKALKETQPSLQAAVEEREPQTGGFPIPAFKERPTPIDLQARLTRALALLKERPVCQFCPLFDGHVCDWCKRVDDLLRESQ
jgi:hypothetical protein